MTPTETRAVTPQSTSPSPSSGPLLIQLEGITKVFYTDEVETHALSGIHLQIRGGDYVSIAGPSGCGKSTLLSILGLLDTPTEGHYTLNGHAWRNWVMPIAPAFATARSVSFSRAST
jgi:ABC-type nitrate/sulfonate/bicarbonate transport system ATPase subunit